MSYCQIDHLITVPQGQLALRQQGAENAPDVLVLGGISGGREIYSPAGKGWWQGLIDNAGLLGYNLWSLDYLGGMGASTCQATPTTVEIQAQAIQTALMSLGVEQLHAIIGGSYGGCVGMAMAAAGDLQVDRLVVLGAAHGLRHKRSCCVAYSVILLHWLRNLALPSVVWRWRGLLRW